MSKTLPTPQGSLLTAALFPDFARVTTPNAPGEKDISLSAFLGLVSTAISRQANAEDLPAMDLPQGLIRIARQAAEMTLLIYREEAIHEVTHTNLPSPVQNPFPNIVMVFNLSKTTTGWEIVRKDFSATRLSREEVSTLPQQFPTFRNSEDLHYLPFPNIYREGGICYGSNSMPYAYKEGNLVGLDYYYTFLYQAPFNNDLSVPVRGGFPTQGDRYLKALEKHKTFPYEILMTR